MRHVVLVLALCALAAGVASSQDAALGIPNQKSPNALGDGDIRATIDWRYWDGGNDTFSFLGEYGLTDRLDIGVAYVTFDNAGEPPIAGALRASDLSGPAVWVKYVGREVEGNSWGWTVVPGVEFLDMEGTNTAIGASAGDQETVFTLEVPIGIPDGDILWLVNPKLAAFPDTAPVRGPVGVQLPATIDSFGTIVGLGLGVIAPISENEKWTVYGDVTPILAGDNSIDDSTNGLAVQLPFTAGVRRQLGWGAESSLDVFVTNCAGATTATSLIAAPDRSVGWGVRASATW
ncbi:MAG: hypothetical protein FJX74_01575 [Armatimonadetes bacterium]|nr:hypothetical protein [Armatimonadota bacterium]